MQITKYLFNSKQSIISIAIQPAPSAALIRQ